MRAPTRPHLLQREKGQIKAVKPSVSDVAPERVPTAGFPSHSRQAGRKGHRPAAHSKRQRQSVQSALARGLPRRTGRGGGRGGGGRHGNPSRGHRDASMDALCQPARGKTGGVRMRSNGNWHEGRRPADLSRPWAWGGQSCLEVGCLLWVRGGGGRATDATDPPPHTHTHLGVPCLEGVQMKAHAWPGTGLAFSSGNFWTKFWGWRMEDEKFFQKDGRTKRGRKWGLSVPLIVPNQSGGQSGAEQRHLFHLNRIL